MRRLLKRVVVLPFRVIPNGIRRRLIQVLVHATAAQSPRAAMRALLMSDDDVAAALNDVAVRLEGGVHVKHRLMKYHDFFVERITPEERVLDIGCGIGAVAYSVAARAGAVVTGIDLNAEHIAFATRMFRHPKLTFIHGDALNGLPQGSFETVMLSNVLEHIQDRLNFLERIRRHLGPRRLLIRVPMFNRDWRIPMRQELGLSYFSDPTHYIEYTRETFEREMREARLAVVHLQINWGEIWAEVRPHA